MTVRRAIKILSDEGIVETIRGSGTYVRLPELQEVKFSLKAFTEMFQDKDRTQVTILDARISEADEIISKKLSISVGDETIQMERVLYRDGDPVVLHKEYLVYDPNRPVVESEMEVTSLHGLFVGNGKKGLKSGDLNIHASVLTREEAHILNTMELQPAFYIEHLFYDFDEKPFSWGWFTCRADRLNFSARVGYRK
jgi:GntR family transcriptional regulator